MDKNAEISAKIIAETGQRIRKSRKAQQIAEKAASRKATYTDALTWAQENGRAMTAAMREYLPEALENGMLYRAAADIVIRGPMEAGAKQVIALAAEIQEALNQGAKIGIHAIQPEINDDQINGIITGICNAESYESGCGEMLSQIENFLEGTVDDCVRENANFQYQAGLEPTIERVPIGKCCEWCDNLAGKYPYSEVRNKGNDVFRRHKNCHCLILFNPGNGSKRRQNVHTRRWTDDGKGDRIALSQQTPRFDRQEAERKSLMKLNLQQFATSGSQRSAKYSDNWQEASLKETVNRFAKGAKQDRRGRHKIYYTSKDGKISVVYDSSGDYFRIQDNVRYANKEKYFYLGIDGNPVPEESYQELTHFKNTDGKAKWP